MYINTYTYCSSNTPTQRVTPYIRRCTLGFDPLGVKMLMLSEGAAPVLALPTAYKFTSENIHIKGIVALR